MIDFVEPVQRPEETLTGAREFVGLYFLACLLAGLAAGAVILGARNAVRRWLYRSA